MVIQKSKQTKLKISALNSLKNVNQLKKEDGQQIRVTESSLSPDGATSAPKPLQRKD